MTHTDTSEKGLERLICTALTGSPCDPAAGPVGRVDERPADYGVGWIGGSPEDYDREYCVDLAQLSAFLRDTQHAAVEALDLGQDGPTRRKFLARLQGEISKRGTIDVLRHGIKHGPHHLDLFYGTPSPGNVKAEERYAANRFSVTRQLRYSRDETQLALDLGLFINGLPVATFELKKRILTRDGLTDILENYAQIVETKDEKTGRKKAVQIWPRFHQLDVVRKLLANAARRHRPHDPRPADQGHHQRPSRTRSTG
jgi:type I restriction enzyme R subunit